MALSVGGGYSRGGRRARGGSNLSEINVTPFVDVALVLLIIFMITAHVMEYGIDIDVPKIRTTESSPKELPVVQLTKTGDLRLGQDPANINPLVDTIHKKYPGQKAVYLRAD